MGKSNLSVLILILFLIPFKEAFAKSGGGQNWLLGVDLSYLSNKTEAVVSNTTSNSESSTTFYDLTLGYFLQSNLMVGGIYSTKNTSSSSGASVSTSTTGSALGASLGYNFDNGVHITGSYFLTATDDNYKKGTGYEVDFGWRSFLSSSVFVGAKLAYRSIKYTENTTISGFDSLTSTTTLPYISFGFGF